MWLEVLHEFHPDASSQEGDPLAAAGGRVSSTLHTITHSWEGDVYSTNLLCVFPLAVTGH